MSASSPELSLLAGMQFPSLVTSVDKNAKPIYIIISFEQNESERVDRHKARPFPPEREELSVLPANESQCVSYLYYEMNRD
jgi:hypothetical protein